MFKKDFKWNSNYQKNKFKLKVDFSHQGLKMNCPKTSNNWSLKNSSKTNHDDDELCVYFLTNEWVRYLSIYRWIKSTYFEKKIKLKRISHIMDDYIVELLYMLKFFIYR
jgi:hypothetical protein